MIMRIGGSVAAALFGAGVYCFVKAIWTPDVYKELVNNYGATGFLLMFLSIVVVMYAAMLTDEIRSRKPRRTPR